MDVETTAAIYGGVAGAVVSGIFSLGALVFGRMLRRRGGIEFTPSNWQFVYIKWEGMGKSVTPSRTVYENVSYQLIYPGRGPGVAGDDHYYAAYRFTVELLNRMDMGGALRNLSVTFLKNGTVLFSHEPFNEDETDDPSGILFEEPTRDVSADLREEAKPPGEGIEPIGTVALPSHIPVRIRLRGYIPNYHSGFHHLRGGCDEVRLHAIRENGKTFDEHVETLIE